MSSDGQRRHVDDLEPRRAVAQQPKRAGHVAAGQHEAVAAGRQAVDEVVQDAAKPREALERAHLEEFVEQHRDRLAAAGAGAAEEGERGVERGAGPARRRLADRERRRGDDGPQETLRRRRGALDVEVERRGAAEPFAQLLEQRRASAAAAADENGNARRRCVERSQDRGA